VGALLRRRRTRDSWERDVHIGQYERTIRNWCKRSAKFSTDSPPRRTGNYADLITFVNDRTRPRTALTRSTRANQTRNWLGNPRKIETGFGNVQVVISGPSTWWAQIPRGDFTTRFRMGTLDAIRNRSTRRGIILFYRRTLQSLVFPRDDPSLSRLR